MALAYDSPVTAATIREAGPADVAFVAQLVTELGYPAAADETRGRLERLEAHGFYRSLRYEGTANSFQKRL